MGSNHQTDKTRVTNNSRRWLSPTHILATIRGNRARLETRGETRVGCEGSRRLLRLLKQSTLYRDCAVCCPFIAEVMRLRSLRVSSCEITTAATESKSGAEAHHIALSQGRRGKMCTNTANSSLKPRHPPLKPFRLLLLLPLPQSSPPPRLPLQESSFPHG